MSVEIRPGGEGDRQPAFEILNRTYDNLMFRMGVSETAETSAEDMAHYWEIFQPILDFVRGQEDQFWVAEQGGHVIGYARSILRSRIRILTEFFVLPDAQEAGLGARLLQLAVPEGDDRKGLLILATSDVRALSRYFRLGLQTQAVACRFGTDHPEVSQSPLAGGVDLTLAEASDQLAVCLADIDCDNLGFRREVEHRWFLSHRDCWLLRRDGEVQAYGYSCKDFDGPYGARTAADLLPLLHKGESLAAEAGRSYGLRVSLGNGPAVHHLLARGFRMDGFFLQVLSDFPMPGLDRYGFNSPALIL